MDIHSKKIKDDFKSYFDDFELSITNSLREHNRNEPHKIFKIVYPLFVILETLSSKDYFLDPAARIELDQCLGSGDKEKIIKARQNLARASIKMSNELKEGLAHEMFTPYFDELYSDSVLLINQYYLNNYRGCGLYIRCMLEDLYKHIYYLDHPQEFYMIQSGVSEWQSLHITPQFLREYLEKTSYLSQLGSFNFDLEEMVPQNRKTIFKLNEDLYRRASAFVHPSNPTYMSQFKHNSDLIYDEKSAQSIMDTTKEIINLAIVFLSFTHFEQVSSFNEYEKKLILIGFDKKTRGNLRKLLGF